MSEFLKFAYELLSQVVYNIVSWVTAFLKLFFLGWMDYFTIFPDLLSDVKYFCKNLIRIADADTCDYSIVDFVDRYTKSDFKASVESG